MWVSRTGRQVVLCRIKMARPFYASVSLAAGPWEECASAAEALRGRQLHLEGSGHHIIMLAAFINLPKCWDYRLEPPRPASALTSCLTRSAGRGPEPAPSRGGTGASDAHRAVLRQSRVAGAGAARPGRSGRFSRAQRARRFRVRSGRHGPFPAVFRDELPRRPGEGGGFPSGLGPAPRNPPAQGSARRTPGSPGTRRAARAAPALTPRAPARDTAPTPFLRLRADGPSGRPRARSAANPPSRAGEVARTAGLRGLGSAAGKGRPGGSPAGGGSGGGRGREGGAPGGRGRAGRAPAPGGRGGGRAFPGAFPARPTESLGQGNSRAPPGPPSLRGPRCIAQ
ncbi:uncharacterized protein LOC141584715 [Saimiri boliviensis]|uniref:uncharacterized protein LOC141584715 n=1 Tax=Saimiri boliviensis TaxID=27679 RepID=UPI003D778462